MTAEDYLLLRVEDGEPYIEEVGGNWMTSGQEEWFISYDEFREVCETIKEVQNRMATPDVFLVRLLGPSVVIEEPGWDLDYGFDVGGIWLEYEGYRIEEISAGEEANARDTKGNHHGPEVP